MAGDAGGGRRERLAERRKALGLTQEDLAALLRVEESTVRRWESGETAPRAWMRPRLAKALRVSPEGLTDLLAIAGSGSTPGPGPGGGPGQQAVVPRQLPAAVAGFTGRATELAALSGMLQETAGAPGTVVISAIGGTAGVGKPTLQARYTRITALPFPATQR